MRPIGFLTAGLAALALTACPPSGNPPDGGAGGGGGGGGTGTAAFDIVTLDPQVSSLKPLSLAIGPGDKVGVAYLVNVDDGTAPVPDYEVRYLEWKGGTASAPQKVQTVQRLSGVSLAFQGSGEPAVAYLGGGSDASVYWLQSDAVVSTRLGATWTEATAVTQGAEAACGNAVSDRGFLVGLFPALVYSGATAYLAYRDGHDGQLPQQDWNASDLELAVGSGGAWTHRCLQAGGNSKLAYGGHTSMVMAGGQPALVHDRVLGSPDGTGQDVLFLKRNPDGSWTSPTTVLAISNTQSGASLAYDPVEGYGIAVMDRGQQALTFTGSGDGVTWQLPDPVFQAGSGGWYPSLAYDPVHHEPAIAFYVCSASGGVNEASCQPGEDELRVTQRVAGNWRETMVDSAGGYLPKLGFLSTGKRVIAYRNPQTGALQLAVEK